MVIVIVRVMVIVMDVVLFCGGLGILCRCRVCIGVVYPLTVITNFPCKVNENY